jgi:magnesium-transporting ATPase (P-type)
VSIGISGPEFGKIREHMPEEHKKIIMGATVFARMGPDQKAQLIEDLQDLVTLITIRNLTMRSKCNT